MEKENRGLNEPMEAFRPVIYVTIAILVMTACTQKPKEIHFGHEECAYCKMIISDERFASQIVTETGKAIPFDAIECMANYAGEHTSALGSAKYWIADFTESGTWIAADDAVIIKSEVIKSPMSASLLAVGSAASAGEHLEKYPGRQVEWRSIVK